LPLTATFPANIGTNNAIDAGNTTLFASLPVMAITLSNGTQAKVSKVTVNNLPVNNDHIINKPGIYTVTLVVPDPDGIELIQNYTLTVRPASIVKNNVDDYRPPMYPKGRINLYTPQASYNMTLPRKLASLKSLASLPPEPTGESAAILVEDHQ
jgi:PKD repeat protein